MYLNQLQLGGGKKKKELNFLKSTLNLRSEYQTQIHAVFFKRFEMKAEFSDLKILVTAVPFVRQN